MRAAQVVRLTGPDGIDVNEIDEPGSDGHVVIDVKAAGVTFPDLLMARGEYQLKPNPPFTPGLQAAGVVRSSPAQSPFAPGARVVTMCGLGGYAEVVAANPSAVFELPDQVDFEVGSTLGINYFTAEFAFERRAHLAPGETVLVQGAAGGVGTASIQVAKAMGATVIAVVSSDSKAVVARQVGADHVVALDGFKDAVKELTAGRGVDVVVDPVGSDRFLDSLRCLAPEGRLLVIGFAGGEIPTVKVNRLLLANTSVLGAAWGEFVFRHENYLAEQWTRILPMLESGAIAPVVSATYPLDGVSDALRSMAARQVTGNVVIDLTR